MSPAIFDWVQSFIEFAIIKSKILLFVHNSIEPNLVLSWRFGDRCIVLEEFILVFLHEVIVYGIKFEFSEVWISCSVTPFFEWCAISSFILILVVGLFWNVDLISNIVFFSQIELLIQFIVGNLLHVFKRWSHYGVALIILLNIELDVLSRHVFEIVYLLMNFLMFLDRFLDFREFKINFT